MRLISNRTVVRLILVAIMLVATLPVLFHINPVFAAPSDAYWVGNSGNWSDATNHWATSSNGTPGSGNTPAATTNVHFDANSFTSAGQTVTIDADTNCLNMDWTGATNSPTIGGAVGHNLRIYGNLIFISAMTVNVNGFFWMQGSSPQTVTTNGLVVISGVYLMYSNGSFGSILYQLAVKGIRLPEQYESK